MSGPLPRSSLYAPGFLSEEIRSLFTPSLEPVMSVVCNMCGDEAFVHEVIERSFYLLEIASLIHHAFHTILVSCEYRIIPPLSPQVSSF